MDKLFLDWNVFWWDIAIMMTMNFVAHEAIFIEYQSENVLEKLRYRKWFKVKNEEFKWVLKVAANHQFRFKVLEEYLYYQGFRKRNLPFHRSSYHHWALFWYFWQEEMWSRIGCWLEAVFLVVWWVQKERTFWDFSLQKGYWPCFQIAFYLS